MFSFVKRKQNMKVRQSLPVLSHCLISLADVYERKGDLAEFAERLEGYPEASIRRFYYLAFLGRIPESQEIALQPVANRLECALEFLRSDEFLQKHIKIIRNMFPTILASFFLHIPKTGGRTILAAQERATNFVTFRTPTDVSNWEEDRLMYFGRMIASLRKGNCRIAVSGHPTAEFLVSQDILGPEDEVFTILRNPPALVISFINYVLTCVSEQRPHRVIDLWGRIVDMPALSVGDKIPKEVVLRILHQIIPLNISCAVLGGATWEKSVEFIKTMGIEMFFLDDLDTVIERKGLPSLPPHNISVKFVNESELDDEVRNAIIEHVKEDIKLYHWANEQRGVRSDASLGNDYHKSTVHQMHVKQNSRKSYDEAALDYFVSETDRRGGVRSPDTVSFWRTWQFSHATFINEELDPFSEEYVKQQLDLYREISGREIDQTINEAVSFEMDDHVASVNPYAHLPADEIGMHISRLSYALMNSKLGAGETLLDLGCGWGLSSELFAYAGLQVTALDINPEFVNLVNTRARQKNLAIEAVQGSFENVPPGPFDAVAYYECLHHAVRPWEALGNAARVLRPGGKLLIAGEPINNYWENWGLRQDPLSIYCIRKFGWFESGWSLNFLQRCIERSGFQLSLCVDVGDRIGWIIVADRQ